jgi:hypothetical protein
MRSIRWVLAAGLICAPLAATAQDTEPRCTILGQMAVSSWLDMLGALTAPDDTVIDPILARLDNLTGIYTASGCEAARLGAAMDCIISGAGNDDPRRLAQACVRDAGLQ